MHDDEELCNVFTDLQISAFSKASTISSIINLENPSSSLQNHDQTKTKEEKEKGKVDLHDRRDGNSSFIATINCSTPKSESLKPNFELRQKHEITYQNDEDSSSSIIDEKNFSQIVISKKNLENPFTHQKLLQLWDKQRFLTVEKVMTERIQNMYDTDKLIHDSLEHLKQVRQEEITTKWLLMEQKILDDIHEKDVENRPKREAQLAEDNFKNAQRIIERNQRVKDAENEARKKSEAILLNRKLRDQVLNCNKEYGEMYKAITDLINSCENKSVLMERASNIIKDLKNYSVECDNLFKRCKTGDISEEDVNQLMVTITTVKELQENINKEIENINLESKKLEDIKLNNVREKFPETKEDIDKTSTGLSEYFDSQTLQMYLNLQKYLEKFENSFKGLIEDNTLKKFRFNCQKAVTIPVNAISPVNGNHLSDKYFKLYNLLCGKMVDVGGLQMSASEHPDGIMFCQSLLAKKFVRQGDLTVSSKPDAAFSIAAVLASLWVDFPDFGQLTLAYFQSSCPYLAPVFMPQIEGQSSEDYYKSIGYHYNANGEMENQDSFLKRMSGIMRLYAAVLISKVRQSDKKNPLGIAEGWRWMSALLNLEPKPDICATLIFDFLEVAGHEMFKTYGAQFKKLLAYICQVYFPKLEKVTAGKSSGPIVRLEGFLQKIMKTEFIPPPDGLLPMNFW